MFEFILVEMKTTGKFRKHDREKCDMTDTFHCTADFAFSSRELSPTRCHHCKPKHKSGIRGKHKRGNTLQQ